MFTRTKAVVLLLALCAACSGDSKGSRTGAAAAPAATSSRSASPFDACALLPIADVDAAFAPRTFTLEPKSPPDVASKGQMAAVSTCTYASRGASAREMLTVGLLARRAPSDASGVTVATAKSGAAQLNATPVDVPALGDAAYWVNLGSATRPSIQLNVFKGPRVWLVFSASAAGLDVSAAVEHLTAIAKTSLSRL